MVEEFMKSMTEVSIDMTSIYSDYLEKHKYSELVLILRDNYCILNIST